MLRRTGLCSAMGPLPPYMGRHCSAAAVHATQKPLPAECLRKQILSAPNRKWSARNELSRIILVQSRQPPGKHEKAQAAHAFDFRDKLQACRERRNEFLFLCRPLQAKKRTQVEEVKLKERHTQIGARGLLICSPPR